MEQIYVKFLFRTNISEYIRIRVFDFIIFQEKFLVDKMLVCL